MRAREADRSGFVERNGVRIYYEIYGEGSSTLLLLPSWSILYSRLWKAQIPYLVRHYRVITFDGQDGEAVYRTICRPVLVVHGDQDRIVSHDKANGSPK